jgi:hypothetical protein
MYLMPLSWHFRICTLESGKKQPGLNMVFPLATALGVSPGELMDAVVAGLAEK